MKPFVSVCIFVLFSSFYAFGQIKEEPNFQLAPNIEMDSTVCSVDVTFYIDFDGSAKVISTDSDNPELVQFVLKKFEKIQVDPKNYFIGKTMRYRFNFKVDPEEVSELQKQAKHDDLMPTFAFHGKKAGYTSS